MKASILSPDILTAELLARGLHVLIGALPAPRQPSLADDVLLAGLAQQEDARLRAALIPLFLQQPRLAWALPRALYHLDDQAQMTLKIYFTAAVLLQDAYAAELRDMIPDWEPLPDIYSKELGVEKDGDVGRSLQQLGRFHTRLTGLHINWPGTYRHAADQLMRRLQLEARWAA